MDFIGIKPSHAKAQRLVLRLALSEAEGAAEGTPSIIRVCVEPLNLCGLGVSVVKTKYCLNSCIHI